MPDATTTVRPMAAHRPPPALLAVHQRYDVVVVGARVAGAATAMLLAHHGLRVLVVDRARRGADTSSTHALLRAGVHQLARWGILDRIVADGTPAVRHVRFHHTDGTDDVPVAPGPGYEGLYAPRRTHLDPLLAAAAEVAGAEVHFEAHVQGLVTDPGGRVRGIRWRDAGGRDRTATAPLVVGADGARSGVARAVGAEVLAAGTNATGFAYTYVEGLEVAGYEWGFAPAGATGLIPTDDGAVLVFAGVPAARFRERMVDVEAGFWSVLHEVTPAVAERVREGRRIERFRSSPGIPGHLCRSHGPGWALVGDAGYTKDPISAHGLTDALVGAELLADAVVEGLGGGDVDAALAGYQRRRDELVRDLFGVADRLAAHGQGPDERRSLLLALAAAMDAEQDEVAGRPAITVPRAA